MSRHFEMYPDHGSIEQLQMATQSNTNNNNVEDRTTERIGKLVKTSSECVFK